ncbi:MAG: phenylalanine--tRNA ligase subunit beta [Frankiaceae bacterium]|nr:phenylalanine--tRNA ligase subunit beta [Frankiaceae bacterium]MBV9368688.1 phenylalanine--tRNA ligase subunit beta [Frankiales bacterium]
MRAPLSWIKEYVDLPADVSAHHIAERLTDAGLKVERVERIGGDIEGVVVARVEEIEELTGFKKPIRWVMLTTGDEARQVICGATNFAVGDVVAYARPPARLPGGFEIGKRPAYGRESDGMICSVRELGIGDDHSGILVLPTDLPLGSDVVDVLGLRDDVLDVSVNPDRGYALSIRGIAREIATAFDVPFRDPGIGAAPAVTPNGPPVRIEDESGCDRYVARVVTGVDPAAASPRWLQQRLTLAGMRPVSLVVDITNAVMLELGQPLHAFDRDKLRGAIVVRRANSGERIRTLDDVDRALDPADLLITDDSGPIAIAGVMGGAATEIGPDTTAVLIESAHFDHVSIAYTARRHRLPSEASRRYERGVDDALADVAAQRAVSLLVELAGAIDTGEVTDNDVRKPREPITFDPALPSRLAGVDYSTETVRRRLADVGCDVTGEDPLTVVPPSWRPDLRAPVDLVEEVVRLEGYAQLPATVPAAPAGRGLTRAQRQRRLVGRAFAAAGFVEVVTYPFVAADIGERLMFEPADARWPAVRLANPVSEQEPYLRPTLLPGLLAAAARNVARGTPDVAIYEVGPVFRAAPGAPISTPPAGVRPSDEVVAAMEASVPFQPLHAAVVLAGDREPAGWWGKGRAADWTDAVDAAQAAAAALGLALTVEADPHAPWHPGRSAALYADGRLVGHAGELHPRVVEAFDLPARACAMELRVDELLLAAPELATAPTMSTYPPATYDLAVVVPDDVPAGVVAAALRDAAGPLVEQVRLFDVYAGDQVPAGHRSLAFAFRLRAPDRTLTAEDVAASRASAIAHVEQVLGAHLRGA